MRDKKELLFSITIKDCEVQAFCSGGPGGQHQNKTASAIRVIHRPSGAIGESREMRSQLTNKQRAFRRMAESEKFKHWIKIEASRRSGEPSIDARVKKDLMPMNLLVETHNDRKQWIVNNELLPTETEIENLMNE